MHPRVSLLLIALYSTKIFCALAFMSKPANRKPSVSNISKTVFIKNTHESWCDNSTSVFNLKPVKPIMPILYMEAIMLID